MNSNYTENGSAGIKIEGPETVISEKVNYDEQDVHRAGNKDTNTVAVHDSSQFPIKRKQVSTKSRGRKYILRSSGDDVRVLRSRSKSLPEPVATPVNLVMKRSKKRRKRKTTTDEYSRARKRIRYLLNRMNYEQSLIDAYAGEGWRGQSAEKIRPEKELERAKSEILHCKVKIRDLFCHLDSLSSEGRLQESLFDSEGQISSDDIFCGKCRSKDSSIDNDIILCDGICYRGFHQKCLNPPLLSADIPVGDEGWLCPACDCKVDVIFLLNESRGTDVLVEDTWEKVFPEAAAIENGDKHCDDFPSDDSEDYEYDPDCPEFDGEDHGDETDHKEQSDSKDSDFGSAEDSEASGCPKQSENFGFPSDDSEDDDFDPDVPDPDKDIEKDGSSSDESDFTSDSDDFCKEISRTLGANEDSASSLLESGRYPEDTSYSLNPEILSTIEEDLNIENVLVSGKRQVERLDYKKKYFETFGKLSSESSGDEDWLESAEMNMSKKRKKNITERSRVLSKANAQNTMNKSSSRSDIGEFLKTETGEQHHDFQESDSNVSKFSTPVNRRLGSISSQLLHECFQENQSPTHEKKDSLAQELGLTIHEVDRWFESTRHSYHISVVESSQAGGASSENNMMEGKGKDQNMMTTSLQEEKPDYVMGQSSSSKGTNSVPASKSNVGAENDSIPDDTSGGSFSINESKGEISVPASRSNVKAQHGNIMGIDKERQKAIARELRRMKQRR